MAASAETLPEQIVPPSSKEIERHAHNYGNFDQLCIRWTDHCRTCNRNSNGEFICSNIGISCQPSQVECVERQQEK
jgi:hypothetical protein